MRRTKLRATAAVVLVSLAALAIAAANGRFGHESTQSAAGAATVEPELSPRLAKKIAAAAKASPNAATIFDSEGNSEGYDSFAAQDWAEKSQDGNDNSTPPFAAFTTARNDWFGLRGRPASGTGRWTPLGPVNGLNDLTNVFRDRTVYTAGAENFSGRISHGVISPDCKPAPGTCTMYVAATNGGVWRTDNALAVDDQSTPQNEGPTWEFVSGTFEQQNSSALELDPNDSTHRTIWAGTGEPNACSSRLRSRGRSLPVDEGGNSWKGPLGADVLLRARRR